MENNSDNPTNGNGQIKFVKWLRIEVIAAFAFGSAIVGLVSYINNPINKLNTEVALIQHDINEINTNHLAHIQEQLAKDDTRIEEQDKRMADMSTKLAEILTILQQQQLQPNKGK